MNKPLRINAGSDRFFTKLSNLVRNSTSILVVDESARYRALAGLMLNLVLNK
jgi:hypothetical protein